MLVFWTMERSLPFGRPPDPAGRPQCMRQAVGTENGAAQPEPDSAPWPGQRLPSSSLPSLLPLSPQPPPPPTPPLKAQHPPAPPPSLCPPRPRPSQPLRRLRTDNGGPAGGERAAHGSGAGRTPASDRPGVRAAHSAAMRGRNSPGGGGGGRFTRGCQAQMEV